MAQNQPIPPKWARILLAPLYWPKLLRGLRWKPAELRVLAAVEDTLSPLDAELLRSQLTEVNYIQRLHEGRTEVNLYSFSILGPRVRRNYQLSLDGEALLAEVDVVFASGILATAEVWCLNGIVFSIEFDRKVNLDSAVSSAKSGTTRVGRTPEE